MASPAFFLQHLMRFVDPSLVDLSRLLKISSQLVGEFWEDPRSMLFAPSTIAISAVIVALSLLKADSQAFTDRLPDFFFPREQDPSTSSSSSTAACFQAESGKLGYLDFSVCLQVIERLPSIRSVQPIRSPVCVADDSVHDGSVALTNTVFESVKQA